MKLKQTHDCSHLTFEERKIIQAGIENNSTKSSIAKTLEKILQQSQKNFENI